MSEDTMTQAPFASDEMPMPPEDHNDGGSEESRPVDGTFEASDLAGVPKMNEPFKAGTYHFRLDGFTTGWNEPGENEEAFGQQPYFVLRWNCQEEPNTGKIYTEFVNWVSEEVFAALRGDPASPLTRAARNLLNRRLPQIKELMDKAEYHPQGKTDLKEFLGSNPEVKIQLAVRERKTKNRITGKLENTGEMTNRTIRYLSLRRRA